MAFDFLALGESSQLDKRELGSLEEVSTAKQGRNSGGERDEFDLEFCVLDARKATKEPAFRSTFIQR